MRVQLCASKRSSPRPPIIISILNRIATPQSTTRSECVSCVVSRTPRRRSESGPGLPVGGRANLNHPGSFSWQQGSSHKRAHRASSTAHVRSYPILIYTSHVPLPSDGRWYRVSTPPTPLMHQKNGGTACSHRRRQTRGGTGTRQRRSKERSGMGGCVCASRSARHCFSSHPVQHGWSKPHRWPNLAFRQPSNDNDGWDCKKRLGRSSGGRAVEQASKKRGVWGIWMGQGI